jgi:hypothetical protein
MPTKNNGSSVEQSSIEIGEYLEMQTVLQKKTYKHEQNIQVRLGLVRLDKYTENL